MGAPGDRLPFYNDDSVPAWHAWLLIVATLFVAVVVNVTTFLQVGGPVFKAVLLFLITLIALLFVAHGDTGTAIKKPRLGGLLKTSKMLQRYLMKRISSFVGISTTRIFRS